MGPNSEGGLGVPHTLLRESDEASLCNSPLAASLARASAALAASAGGVLAAMRGAGASRICSGGRRRQRNKAGMRFSWVPRTAVVLQGAVALRRGLWRSVSANLLLSSCWLEK